MRERGEIMDTTSTYQPTADHPAPGKGVDSGYQTKHPEEGGVVHPFKSRWAEPEKPIPDENKANIDSATATTTSQERK